MTDKPKNFEPAAPGNRHLTAEALGLADKPKDADEASPDATDYGGTEPVLDDATFDALDTDGDRVVHLTAEAMKGTYPIEAPEGRKSRAEAPENKDAAALRDDKSKPEPTQLPAEPNPIAKSDRGRRGR